MQTSTSVPTAARRLMMSSISSFARLTRLHWYRQTYGADRRTLFGNSAISRRETHIEMNMDWKANNNTHLDRSPDVWGQPMSKNYSFLRGLHHLTSEKMYVLEWKTRNRKQMQPTLHSQVPAERRLKRLCFLISVRPADFPAVNG